MRKFKRIFLATCGIFSLIGIGVASIPTVQGDSIKAANADVNTYTFTATASNFLETVNGNTKMRSSITSGGITWTTSISYVSGSYISEGDDRGIQLGSGNVQVKEFTISAPLNSLGGTINSISIGATSGTKSTAGDKRPTISISLNDNYIFQNKIFSKNDTVFTSPQNTTYDCNGVLKISMKANEKKALYFKDINIEYSASTEPAVTISEGSNFKFKANVADSQILHATAENLGANPKYAWSIVEGNSVALENSNGKDLTLKPVYKENSKEIILGKTTLKVTATDDSVNPAKSATASILVDAVNLENIVIETNPNKTNFKFQEDFDSTGLTIRCNYSDKTFEILKEGFTVQADTSILGTSNALIKVGSFECSYKITVTNVGVAYEKELLKLTKSNLKLGEYNTTEKDIKVNNVDFYTFNLGHFNNSGKIQFKKYLGYISNKTTFDKNVTIVFDGIGSDVLLFKQSKDANLHSTKIDVNDESVIKITGSDNSVTLSSGNYFKAIAYDSALTLNSVTINENASNPKTQAEAYANYFIDTLNQKGYCDPTGNTPKDNINRIVTAWTTFEKEYAAMSNEAKVLFKNAVNDDDNGNASKIDNAKHLYTVIMNKYAKDHKLNNFMVDEANKPIVEVKQSNDLNAEFADNSMIIVCASVLVIALGLTSLLIIKRRRIED